MNENLELKTDRRVKQYKNMAIGEKKSKIKVKKRTNE